MGLESILHVTIGATLWFIHTAYDWDLDGQREQDRDKYREQDGDS